MAEDPIDPLFVSHTIRRAAELLGLSRSTIYELINEGKLELVKDGRRSLIPHKSLLVHIERLRRERLAREKEKTGRHRERQDPAR